MRNIMSIRTTVMLCWVAVFWGGVLIGTIHSVSLNGNGYEFTVAISEDALQLDAEQRVPFLDALKKTMTDTSKMLFDATDSKVFFKKVNILLPRAWTLTGAPTSTYNYLNADMRIETTMTANDPETVVQAARSYNSKMCGQPGEYIIAPPQFFLNSNGATVKKYGDPAKVMLHEFAHYRYGVHKENGIPGMFIENGDKFPYTFKNPRGEWQLTGSNNSKIEGSYAYPEDQTRYCEYPNTPDMTGDLTDLNCRFIPDMTATTGPTTSLMFMPFLPTVTKFSDETNHDRAAPNMQNYWCRNRSTKTIISKHPDFTNLNPSDASTNTVPEFSYLLPAYQTVYIVMDTSSHTLTDDTVFNYVKSEIENKLIPQLAATSPRSFVGIATMVGANFNSSNGRLGGYLTEIQAPIQVDNNEILSANKVNGLTRSSGSGLLIEKAMLDVGDVLTSFTHLSGSIALVFKLNDITNMNEMKVESEAVHLLNSRNARLITFEYNDDSSKNVMERSTLLTGGTHFTANLNSYQSVISSVFNKTVELVRDPKFRNRRVQLLRDPFTSNSATPFRKFYTVDFVPSSIEMHFFVPIGRPDDYQILVNGTDGKTKYNLSSPEHVQKYSSWDRKYKIHTFTIPSTSSSTTATFMVDTTGEPLSGFYEAVEILGENVPVYVGGGGQSKNRVIDVEVYTSGKNGVLNMADIYEDPSFLIFASIRKGYAFARTLKFAVATVHGPNATQQSVSLRDDGLYPDLLAKDGIYTGFYNPTKVSGKFHVSVLLDGYRRSDPLAQFNNNPSSRSIPIDQNEDSSYLEVGSTSSFQRWIPYAASLDVRSAIFYKERPARIMDLRIDNYDSENQKVTFSWTSPQDSYGKNMSVASYRLVYSLYPDQIINDDGQIPETAVEVDPSTIVEGSLDPLQPFVRHSVTINPVRDGPAPPSMYFTMNSNSTLGFESFAAPMVYLTESEVLVTTVSTTTVTTRTTAAVTTPTASTTTSKPTTYLTGSEPPVTTTVSKTTFTTPTTTAVTTPTTSKPTTASTAARTSTTTTKPSSPTTAQPFQPNGAQITRVSSVLFYSLLSVALILISAL
ncbi:calcium-activated chloride channel regulator 3A-1-like [Daphnia pulicaria]|uniref:calcium-activated chloride channel regulator 3A-1-like n=1 Tax=Daphnia pulicaria TaxID=35523 RepID=UPI001EE9F5BA|nr:calcium-activated chloride channel regulator 3A-1-like [Daphnia pulicaria]